MPFAAILFDLFDTLVRFHRDRLPTVEIDGRTVHSTVGRLHAVLAARAPDVTLGQLHRGLHETWLEAERRRAIDHREVSAHERFTRLVEKLDLPGAPSADLVDTLLQAHRQELTRVAEVPAPHRALLAALARDFRLAVVSNFDYTPTALGILAAAGVEDLFASIVVSDEVGWRKPSPLIFREALRRVGVQAGEALFVGDRADIDVLGARGVGLPVAWLNPGEDPLPPGIDAPDYEIRDLDELPGILRA